MHARVCMWLVSCDNVFTCTTCWQAGLCHLGASCHGLYAWLQGGLLYVEIRKASGLISKPLYMLGRPALPDLM